ncbi:MAG: DUF2269 domain-containing protein [Alphaproteobacteria bacterium]|nr:DUF2269 domain-containing protein [Alphaproteobacteria bacterium]
MLAELIFRWLHVIGATVLLGTGAGIAFFMVAAVRTRDPALIAHVTGSVVVADFIFTATAVIAQPVTGVFLALLTGWSLSEPWIIASLVLYGVTGAFWLPVVWIQARLRQLAQSAALNGEPLPDRFDTLYRIWFVFGFPAFAAVLTIVWLMISRPPLWG